MPKLIECVKCSDKLSKACFLIFKGKLSARCFACRLEDEKCLPKEGDQI